MRRKLTLVTRLALLLPAAVLYTFWLSVHLAEAYPQGAPAEACESLSPARGHGVASQPVEYSPFNIIQSVGRYKPGEQISVQIVQRDPNATFKGFLVQALDPVSHQVTGCFITGPGMNSLKECAAVTHADPRPKKSANLVWEAPYNKEGEILFRGTIVIRKEQYYENILAHVDGAY